MWKPPGLAQKEQGRGNGNANGGSGAALPSNPIGSLQEYCVKCSLPLPIYDLQNTIGQPHQRNFEMMAKVGTVNSAGSGKTIIGYFVLNFGMYEFKMNF